MFKIVLVVALFQPLTVRAQTTPEWTPGAVPIGSKIGMFAAFPVIQGQPYTADVLQQQTVVMSDGKRLGEAHNIHRRDSNGRLLDESLPSPSVNAGGGVVFTVHGFTLVDPTKMLSTQWDDHTRTAVINSIRAQPPLVDNFETPCPTAAGWAKVEQQKLGQRMIHSIIATGCRTTGITHGEHPRTVVIETWRSPVLRITLLETEHDSDGSESRMEVTGLELGEPDLTKFVPPQEYKQMMTR